MDPLPLATRVAAIERRRAGSDAERRAALVLADALRGVSRRRRRTTAVETVWVRPHRGPVHALLAALAVAGSVLSVDHPVLGLALAGAALLLFTGDLSGRFTLPRRLTFERATQNVVARDAREARVRLVVTAAVDAPTPGLLGRGLPARIQSRLRRRLRGHLPGPYGVLAAALVALVACTLARVLGVEGTLLGAAQLVPTVLALVAVGAALDQSAADAPLNGANAEASAAAVAVALVAALDADPPRELAVDCVLAGAGGAGALGLRRWIREERRDGRRAEEVAVLHVAACGAGRPVFWLRDGLVLALRFHPRLVALARQVGLAPHESREGSGARAARAVRWPAIAVGCVDADGVVPRLGGDDDTVERLDPQAIQATLEACVALVRALDAELAQTAAAPAATRRRRLPPSLTRLRGGPLPGRSVPRGGAAPGPRSSPRGRAGHRGHSTPLDPETPPVPQPASDAWRERPPAAPPPQAPPPPPTSARAARRAAAEHAAAATAPDGSEG